MDYQLLPTGSFLNQSLSLDNTVNQAPICSTAAQGHEEHTSWAFKGPPALLTSSEK